MLLLGLGWGMFFVVVLPGNYVLGDHSLFGLGLAITAFTLGIRHAFDADHIAAIDNTTRKLAADGQEPVSVGFWFALGHSTVVVVAVSLLAAGSNVLAAEISDDGSTFTTLAGVWGVVVSGVFLVVIGAVNFVTLRGIWQVFHRMRGGEFDEAQLDKELAARGVLNRILGPLSRRVDAPWKMYPIGVLFGLGFDTATTIGLFVVGGSAALTAPWYVVLVLPILFTAGMTLFDTLDGVVMKRAYAWAYARPVRKVYYNLTVTAMSVAVAFLVGGVGLIGLLADQLKVRSGPLAWVGSLDLENFGFIIVAVLLATWLGSFAYWKLARVEARYTSPR
ncbi:HoxN/HupN/NixA family nickel/cobalt transporter [Cryobacterium sp. N22]|uniref:HoxN/HupN/NixA family nickel/cobalt transporter n=1 Tax=Cryobacterium sp. N22 TaxID=2048290 RepID=UPI001E5F5F99|nr:HoxN/HupN/NixA family nickel/cobalt transporter [Cryobacterium sp. N22]